MDHGMPSSVVDAMPMVDAAMPSHAGARWRVWTRCGGALVARERVARRRTDPRPLSAACPARRPPHSRPRPRDAAMECTARRVHRPAAFMRPHWLAGQHPPFGPPPSRLRRGSDDTSSRASRVPAAQLTVKSSSESGEGPRSAVPPDESRLAGGRAPEPTDEPEFHSDEPTSENSDEASVAETADETSDRANSLSETSCGASRS